MNRMLTVSPPVFELLPENDLLDGSIGLDFVEGIPVLRASHLAQKRIETLLERQRAAGLSRSEDAELEAYAEMDDYLSFLNRIVRNLHESAQREN